MKIRTSHFLLALAITFFAGYYVGTVKIKFEWDNYTPRITAANKVPPASQGSLDFTKFWQVLTLLEKDYYDKSAITTEKILNGAISGMVQSLGDPYTMYLQPKQNKDFRDGLAGQQFQGIGAELGIKNDQIIVIAPLNGMPAQKAGIQAGDVIVKVDGKVTSGWTISQAVENIRGPKGTTVTLTIVHKNERSPKDIKIVRDTINVKSVEGWVKDIANVGGIKISSARNKRVAYIRISQFGDKTNQEWISVVNDIAGSLHDPNFAGIVLDVRNNPGGYLTDARFIASEFIKEGVVVIEEKGSGEQRPYMVERNGLFTNAPLVVLINKGSASAAEIVSGALRDHKRAKLIGEVSFGKGTIQQAQDLGQGAGLHVTVAKWLTPNGTWVHEKGLIPDIEVLPDDKDQSRDLQLEKAVLELIQ